MNSAVFFDLDGTLTDPKTGIVGCIRFALDRLGLDCPGDDELTWCIGPPLLDSFRELAGDELAACAVEHYRERFADVGWKENSLYAGITDALQVLKASGRPLYVATSKPLVFAERIIRHFALDKYFVGIFGAELDGTRSNKGELLRFALAETGATNQAVMVGDRKHDIAGARANRMRSVGVTYGYGSQQELESAGADAVVHSPQLLVPALT